MNHVLLVKSTPYPQSVPALHSKGVHSSTTREPNLSEKRGENSQVFSVSPTLGGDSNHWCIMLYLACFLLALDDGNSNAM